MANLVMRFDMRNPDFGASTDELYKAAIDMSVWADENDFDTIQISEHHASDDGYLASPIVLASAIASRTKRVKRLEPYILHEINSYNRWIQDSGTEGQYVEMDEAKPLVEMGLYPVLNPEQAIKYAEDRGEDGNVCLHPLISGLPPAIGWEQLNTFAETLLPIMRPGS